MRFKKLSSFCILILSIASLATAQNAKIGQFYDHLPYSSANAIAKSDDKIFVATGQTMFTYDITDGSIETLSKVNVLSDLGITALAYSNELNKLIIGYESGNIDILQNNTVTNIPDVIRTSIQGFKSINNIIINGDFAFISAGFGVIKLDISRNEIRETYFIGDDATSVFVNQIVLFNDSIYAATGQGIYVAQLEGTNLVDFQNWTLLSNIPRGNYNTIAASETRVLTNFVSSTSNKDTVWQFTNNTWSKGTFPNYTNFQINEIVFQDNRWFIATAFGARFVSADLTITNQFPSYGSDFPGTSVGDIIIEPNRMWVADKKHGLMLREGGTYTQFLPAGPSSYQAWAMDYRDNELWVASGSLTPGRGNNNLREGIYRYKNRVWTSYNEGLYESLRDLTSIAINPVKTNEIYTGSYRDALIRTDEGEIVAQYNKENSKISDNTGWIGYHAIGGLAFDQQGTLWVTVSGLLNSLVEYPLVAFANEEWHGYKMNNLLTNVSRTEAIIVDEFNNKWFTSPGSGIYIFNDNGTLSDQSDDQIAFLTTGESKGNLPTKEVKALALDQDSKLWIGTAEGLTVINSTFNPFDNQLRADRIIIEQDGAFEFLLESVIINTIKVDGANRKWIGTQSNGVFLISADGQETIHHFTAENSPLLSNTIFDVEIFGSTGEVFFATDKGLMSYIGDATDPESYDGPTYAYPNPVRPDYEGEIGIKGLAPNSEVKITDITGNVIYETFSKGTTATWDGNSLNGKRAQTGVYIVFSVTDDGNEKEVAKILFIN